MEIFDLPQRLEGKRRAGDLRIFRVHRSNRPRQALGQFGQMEVLGREVGTVFMSRQQPTTTIFLRASLSYIASVLYVNESVPLYVMLFYLFYFYQVGAGRRDASNFSTRL